MKKVESPAVHVGSVAVIVTRSDAVSVSDCLKTIKFCKKRIIVRLPLHNRQTVHGDIKYTGLVLLNPGMSWIMAMQDVHTGKRYFADSSSVVADNVLGRRENGCHGQCHERHG